MLVLVLPGALTIPFLAAAATAPFLGAGVGSATVLARGRCSAALFLASSKKVNQQNYR